MRTLRVSFILVLTALVPSQAFAQAPATLARLLPDLILREIFLPPAGDPGRPHTAHFSPLNPLYEGRQSDVSRIGAVRAIANLNRLLGSQFATFPLGSSSGGLTFAFNEATGTYSRTTSSFGPAFAERATTIGRNRLSVAFNYQRTSFDRFEGQSLEDGSVRFYIPHNDCCPGQVAATGQAGGDQNLLNPPFEGDVLEVVLSMGAKTDTFAAFATYGLTDRWDVGVAVPIMRTDIDAVAHASIQRLATANFPLIHTFVEGQDVRERTVSAHRTATGLGDVTVRTKFNALPGNAGGLGVGLDLRLPTGDADDLAGTGTTQAKVYLVGSGGAGRLSQHFNVGYTFSGTNDDFLETLATDPRLMGAFSSAQSVPDEFNYAGGVEFVPTPRVTIVGDVIGRVLRDIGRLDVTSRPFVFQVQGAAAGTPPRTANFDEFEPREGNPNLLLGTAGVKVNVGGNLLLSGQLLFPLNDAGLRPKPTPVIGLDYMF